MADQLTLLPTGRVARRTRRRESALRGLAAARAALEAARPTADDHRLERRPEPLRQAG